LTKRYRVDPDDVLRAACELADEQLGNSPTHGEIAERLQCSRQLVQMLFRILENDGAVEWINRNRYKILRSEWQPPPDIDI
jgi:Mn-dependent DtxR family transcriptional regulator